MDLQRTAIQAESPLSEATIAGHFTALDLLQVGIHTFFRHYSEQALSQKVLDFINHALAISSTSEREETEYTQGIGQGLLTIQEFLQSQIPQTALMLVSRDDSLPKAA